MNGSTMVQTGTSRFDCSTCAGDRGCCTVDFTKAAETALLPKAIGLPAFSNRKNHDLDIEKRMAELIKREFGNRPRL